MKIYQHKEPMLFQKAVPVKPEEFGEDLEKRLSEMAQLMYASRGVGLAGNQVGDLRQILVMDIGYVVGENYGATLLKVVNPEILSMSEELIFAEEGCLSYPDLSVSVLRPKEIEVKFFSPSGEERMMVLNSWQARIFLHEYDHLLGTTLYSRASFFARKRYDSFIKKHSLKK